LFQVSVGREEMSRKHWRNRRSGEKRRGRGQAVVEFALVMALFLVFLLALLDLGRAYFTVVTLENAAAEGSLFGMANPNCRTESDGQSYCGGSQNSIEYRVKHESTGIWIDPDDLVYTVTLDSEHPAEPGTMITVTVVYPFRPILPLLSAFGADTIWIRRDTQQLIP